MSCELWGGGEGCLAAESNQYHALPELGRGSASTCEEKSLESEDLNKAKVYTRW